MSNITTFPRRSGGASGGDGSDDVNLVFRVEALEKANERIESALKRIEEALKALTEENKAMSKSLSELREKVAHIDGRLANIPTTWQIVGILLGIAAIIFTASRFLHP